MSRLTQRSPQLLSRCSNRSSHCATIVCYTDALTARVNVWSVHLKSDLYLDGIWVACVSHPLLSVHVDLKQGLAACVQSEHTPNNTALVPVHFTFLFGTPLHHPIQASVSQRVVHHAFAARPGLLSRTQSHSVRTAALKPPLIVLGTVVQVFSSLRDLCSMLPWHSMVAAPCHVPLTSFSASSDSVLVLCDACWDWTSGAGLCRRLVDS